MNVIFLLELKQKQSIPVTFDLLLSPPFDGVPFYTISKENKLRRKEEYILASYNVLFYHVLAY